MARIRLGGWYDKEHQAIKAEHRATATHGTIDKKYIRKEKIEEMDDVGYAYTNIPKEFMV